MVPDLQPIIQRVADLSNAFVGMESMFPPKAGSGVHPAWIEKAGGTFSRLTYPSLWAWADSHGLVVSEAEWQTIKAASPNGSVSVFSSGDNTATFRAPDVGESGGFMRALKGASVAPIGDIDGGFDSQSATISGNNETSPRGMYQRVYIYTGSIVEGLPTPTPSWLAAQQVNTDYRNGMEARTWQSVTSSRALGVNYQNLTGVDIEVDVSINNSTGSINTINGVVGGVAVGNTDLEPSRRGVVSFTVPNGSTYSAVATNTSSPSLSWKELR